MLISTILLCTISIDLIQANIKHLEYSNLLGLHNVGIPLFWLIFIPCSGIFTVYILYKDKDFA